MCFKSEQRVVVTLFIIENLSLHERCVLNSAPYVASQIRKDIAALMVNHEPGVARYVLWRPKNFGRHFLDIQVKCK
jgi:hypothetical protein